VRPAPVEAPRTSAAVWALAAVFLAAHAALGVIFVRSAAATYDEAVHLASGYVYLRTGRYRLNAMDHPPLAEMWAAVPLLALNPSTLLAHPACAQGRPYHCSDAFLYHNRVPAERMLGAGRTFSFLTLSALLAAGLLTWARRLGGGAAMVAASAALAFCPVLGSNLALVTTDGASAVLFFLVFRLLSVERRSRGRWLAAGACAGLALAAKFNMILLGPLVAGTLLLEHALRRARGDKAPFPWGGAALACLACALALAAVYRFGQLPVYFQGLSETLARLGQGRSSFFMGSHSTTGFLLYFPVVLAVKTPLPLLGLALAGLVLWARDRSSWREGLWVAVPMAGYFSAALSSKTQIGVRHLLPMIPLLLLAAAWAAGRLWEKGRWGKGAGVLLAAWLAASVVRVAPHSLAYFNELVGPAAGYRWFVDSNLDWGQDLKGLAAEVKALGDPPIYLSYFGCADPASFGLRYVPVAPISNVERPAPETPDPVSSGRVLLAASATNLQATYYADKTLFAWLKSRTPLRTPGYSIFLYDLSGDVEGRRRLAALLQVSGRPELARTLLLE